MTVDRDLIPPAILEEINATNVYGSDDVVWPSSIKIRIDGTIMDFMHSDGTLLITMDEGDTGFHATRMYFLLLDRFLENEVLVVAAMLKAKDFAENGSRSKACDEIYDTLARWQGPSLE
jgi:uncharacterized protein with PIN domain